MSNHEMWNESWKSNLIKLMKYVTKCDSKYVHTWNLHLTNNKNAVLETEINKKKQEQNEIIEYNFNIFNLLFCGFGWLYGV